MSENYGSAEIREVIVLRRTSIPGAIRKIFGKDCEVLIESIILEDLKLFIVRIVSARDR
ncbi:hypothetical protein [Mesotoga sp. BH458_6_3_2_1]|uniref:hypothetical protein n=1 Tax=Mesotoga sp. BH458_6_3_2_1 TaxID=1437446 RepID=UPI0015FF0D6E|nr:hypothetical protein [Mesotoga sp. BH458_6_3_2_1]